MRGLQPKGEMTGRKDAARGAAVLLACLALAGCEIPKEVNPVEIYREVSGLADQGRLPPPGLEQPYPNLASVPPRPERPPAATRAAISAALERDRAQSREPLVLRAEPGTPAANPAPGEPGLPAAPPPRPSLAGAPRIPWTELAPAQQATPAGAATPATPRAEPEAPRLPEVPQAAPALPPPDLLGAPPPPSPDLLAPPRPR